MEASRNIIHPYIYFSPACLDMGHRIICSKPPDNLIKLEVSHLSHTNTEGSTLLIRRNRNWSPNFKCIKTCRVIHQLLQSLEDAIPMSDCYCALLRKDGPHPNVSGDKGFCAINYPKYILQLVWLDQPLHLLHCVDNHLLLVMPSNHLQHQNATQTIFNYLDSTPTVPPALRWDSPQPPWWHCEPPFGGSHRVK